MGISTLSAVLCLCLSTVFATYGPEYHKNHGSRGHHEGGKVKLEEPRIHLDSPKIILDRPSINVQGGSHHSSLHEEEPIILENERPLYIRKTLHGIPASHGTGPLVVDSGYSTGKVLDISAPIQVINHAPVVHERPILIRRPVVVSKALTTTQDHLERLHYAHAGLGHSGLDYGHAISDYAVPISKGLHEGTVVYGGHGFGHGHGLGYGIGHIVPSYSSPIIVDHPRAYLRHSDIGYASGKALHGAVHHVGSLHGGHGAILHGGSLHGGHGAILHGGSLHGGHGAILHGGNGGHAGEGLKKY